MSHLLWTSCGGFLECYVCIAFLECCAIADRFCIFEICFFLRCWCPLLLRFSCAAFLDCCVGVALLGCCVIADIFFYLRNLLYLKCWLPLLCRFCCVAFLEGYVAADRLCVASEVFACCSPVDIYVLSVIISPATHSGCGDDTGPACWWW